ncbi:NAD(P)-binding protein [Aspergillus ellipticus CBS 707.79]|uniref:NAD(P)-binding protein n=1 Tax=Aspergillus ellipticus CBS 707.79 TaxID=1448320 RepID=A0A319D6V7_9EURO|nr:NAD(P)-binding protein [Aspergillus ellipticus CBS 707.79]
MRYKNRVQPAQYHIPPSSTPAQHPQHPQHPNQPTNPPPTKTSLPLLTIFSSTSPPAQSIITTLLTHATRLQTYRLRALTRSPSSPLAQTYIASGIEVLPFSFTDPSTLTPALSGSHTIILITQTNYGPALKSTEYAQAKTIGDASVSLGVKHIVFSGAVHASPLWDGRAMDTFDSKGEAEGYLRGLGVKVSAYYPGMFMHNFLGQMRLQKIRRDTGRIVVKLLEDAEGVDGGDEGKEGKTAWVASGAWSFEEMAGIIGRVSGEKVRYERVAEEVYKGFMPETVGGQLVDMMRFIDEVGYYGGGEEKVRETERGVRGGLTSFEEFAEMYFKTLE